MVSVLCCSMGWIHKDHHTLPMQQHWQTEASRKDFYSMIDSEFSQYGGCISPILQANAANPADLSNNDGLS